MDPSTEFSVTEVQSILGEVLTQLATKYGSLNNVTMNQVESICDTSIRQHAVRKQSTKVLENSKWDSQGRPRFP